MFLFELFQLLLVLFVPYGTSYKGRGNESDHQDGDPLAHLLPGIARSPSPDCADMQLFFMREILALISERGNSTTGLRLRNSKVLPVVHLVGEFMRRDMGIRIVVVEYRTARP